MTAKIQVSKIEKTDTSETITFRAVKGAKDVTGKDTQNSFSPEKKPEAVLTVKVTAPYLFGAYKKGDVFTLSLAR